MLKSITSEYHRYKKLAEAAIAQVEDDDLNRIIGSDNNSIAVIVRHIAGNLKSRFTNFLTTDGEKPWRKRDGEFEEMEPSRVALLKEWDVGWQTLFDTLAYLTSEDLPKEITIRSLPMTVTEALHRSLAHLSYHVGQIVTLSRIHVGDEWQSLSIARGQSERYNQDPTKERQPH